MEIAPRRRVVCPLFYAEIASFPGMLSAPPPDESPEARSLRGRLFTDLDRLAFALEMEANEMVKGGRDEDARRRQELRLGVRLAQRLVAGIWADEVHQRINQYSQAYDSRLRPVAE